MLAFKRLPTISPISPLVKCQRPLRVCSPGKIRYFSSSPLSSPTFSLISNLKHKASAGTRLFSGVAVDGGVNGFKTNLLGGILGKRLDLETRFFSANSARLNTTTTSSSSANAAEAPLPILTPPSVARWLLFSSTLVFAVIVVGGVTRLTESGLSITEWQPVTGVLPPLSQAEWEVEFEKYKLTPEFKLLNHSISLSDFKSIFYMEWSHRILGRLIGLSFIVPLAYFSFRNKISPRSSLFLTSLALLIGAQGALGWYMVKSGLDDELMETPNAVPRVSQYRLAAHLGLALALYTGMFGSGMAAVKDWKWAKGGMWNGLKGGGEKSVVEALRNPLVKRFKAQAWVLAGLVFVTALSGAFVAGLDAGLLYNEFPLMGGRLAPPTDELMSPAYAKAADKSDLWWRNIFENPTTVQFDHRVLAITTYAGTAALYAQTFKPALRAALPPLVRMATGAAFAMANVQVLLGISTLLYLVPVPLAASHQAGSVALLSAFIHLLVTLRRPGMAARLWRKQWAGTAKKASALAST